MVLAALVRAASAAASASAPPAIASAAASTAKPVPIPTCRESTGVTGTEARRAASWADSKVPLSSAEMCTETISSAPSAASLS